MTDNLRSSAKDCALVQRSRGAGRVAAICLLAALSTFAAARPAVAFDHDAAVAGVLSRLLQFMTWPESAFPNRQAPLVVGVLDASDQADALHRAVMGRSNAGHPIEIRMLHSTKEVRGCHLVYIDPQERDAVSAIVAATAGTSTLTVSDMPGFLGEGGNVALVVEDNHPAFDVNLTAVEQTGVHMSSRLLQVARAVLRAGM